MAKRLRSALSKIDPAPEPALSSEMAALFAQAAAGIVLTDADGRILDPNARFCEMVGRSRDDLIGRTTADFTHPDDLADTRSFIDQTSRTADERQIRKRYVRPDGGVTWVLLSVRTLRDASGKADGLLTVAVDTTAETLAARDLSESEERFRLMADTAPSPVWLTDAEGAVEFVNVALVEFYGQPAEQILGHVWRQAIHPDDVADVTAAQAAARPHHKPYGFECRFQRADGAWRWMRVSVNPRFDGEGTFHGYVGLSFDVTDSREAFDRLAESEQRFRALADTAPVLIWVTRADRSREFVNQAYVAYMGGDYETVRDADWRVYIHPDDQDRLVAESLAGEATREPFSLEARYLRHDGEYRWLKSFSRPRIAPDGSIAGFVGVAFDVTDLRDANARLTALAAERDAILNQLAEGVIVTDTEGRIIFVNAAATRAHGVSRLDVGPDEYSQAYSLFTDDGAPYPPEQLPLARAVREGVAITDARWRIRRPDGSEVIAVGNARPLLDADGRSMGAVLTLRDETARIQAERLLAESESRFRTVADSAPAFIWMTDPQTRVVFANARYETVFGVEAGDLLGGRWLKLAHPDDIEAFTETFMTAARSHARFEGLLRVEHPTLGWRWLRAEGIPRFDDAGVFQGYVGASLDVTDARRAEQDLKRVNELLEERVSEALAEKAKAEADLMHAQRMEAVGRLTGGVAHDFNNLLTVVIGALDLILRSPEDAARRKKLGEAALSAARRGERLTHQLLAFSRRQALRPEAIDLNALIREGEPLLRRAVGEAIEFRLKLRRGGARVSVDPAQFEAALLNLIVNARDALGDTGKVTVETMNCAVKADEVRELDAGDYVCVTVTDDGTGMDEATQGRVFEPFFTTKAVGKGTGLGLSQVYGFARQSGGGVHIRSAPGEGTTIAIYLPPLAADQVLAPTVGRREGSDTSRDRRVLLVEDDPGVSAIAVELLEGLGYAVEAVESGPAALEALALGGFDAMLSDVVMPGGMSGIELAALVGRHYPTLRVALTSGYAGDDVDAALADAPWPFLRKPYSRDQLRDTMDALTA